MKTVKDNLEKEIEKVLDEAIELVDLSAATVSSSSIAERIYNSEPELMEQLKPFWMRDRLHWIICRRRTAFGRLRKHDAQLVLPGFQGLPRAIFLPDGHRKTLNDANMTEIRQHLQILRTRLRNDPKIKQMEAVLELMRKYSHERSRITWGEVKTLEFERGGGDLSI